MRRFALCLVAYVVATSSVGYQGMSGVHWYTQYKVGEFEFANKQLAEDMAEALNAAHERLHPTLGPVEQMPDWMIIHQSGNHLDISTYPKACEPDGCGRDPR